MGLFLRSGVIVVALVMLCIGVRAQPGCAPAMVSLTPCLGFMTGNSSAPSSQCCSQLSTMVQSQGQCLCALLSRPMPFPFNIPINQTQAMTLPGACRIQAPPLSQCQSSGGVISPAGTAPPAMTPTAVPPVRTPLAAPPTVGSTTPDATAGPPSTQAPQAEGPASSPTPTADAPPTTGPSAAPGSISPGTDKSTPNQSSDASSLTMSLFVLLFASSWASNLISL